MPIWVEYKGYILNTYTKDLVKLSKIDKALDSYTPQINEIKSKVAKAQKRVDELSAKRAEITALIENNNEKIKSFEIQIQELKDQLDSIKKKQALVKTEKEITHLSSEEHIAKDTLSYNNDEIERLNKINDVKRAELEEIDAELAEATATLEKTKEEVAQELKNIEEQKSSLYEQRDKAIRAMDLKILAFYEKIRKWAENSAVVKVENQACYGCYMKINDKAYSDLIKGEEIVTCPHCGRVLYLEVESESVEA